MRAESQTMLVAAAQGQETVQALFMQTLKKEQGVILNCQFERDPEDGKLYYVFAGTQDGYLAFRTLMEDYGVYPVQEIEGHRLNPATLAATAPETLDEAPVVDTAPASSKSNADTTETLELSATEGVVININVETADVPPVRSAEHADSGQPALGEDRQAGARAGGDVDDGGRSGASAPASGREGRDAAGADPSGPVDGHAPVDDAFASLTAPDPAAKYDPFADM